MSKYDCLRANKATSAWGVEARVPFLDREFVDYAMSLNPILKMCGPGVIEKKILREALAEYLPAEILWRQKEQFSDGVGYSWIDSLKAFADSEISDVELSEATESFPYNTPVSKEQLLYRRIFSEHFAEADFAKLVPNEASVACSTALALQWDAAFQENLDPSGRSIRDVHKGM